MGIAAGLRVTNTFVEKGTAYILVLDWAAQKTSVQSFATEQEANEVFTTIEKENMDKPNLKTVMVSVDSVESLRTAYPSYYLDTTQFLGVVQGLIGGPPVVIRPPGV